jgi:methanogenic corrinoid protein MtbC1
MEGILRTQLLERRSWQDYGEMACPGDAAPVSWQTAVADEAEAPGPSVAGFVTIDIVPGLVLAHRPPFTDMRGDDEAAEIVDEFAALVLAEEAPALLAYVNSLHLRGATIETLYLGLLSATARRLGEYWDADTANFASVTIGLWRLQEVLRNLSAAFQIEGPKPSHGHRALLLSTAGEQHNFGLAMLGEFLFRDGWSVAGGPGLKSDEIGGIVRSEFFSIAGVSLSSESRLEACKAMIRLIRRSSCNPNIVIMVGGALFIQHPELVAVVGADATAPDARQAALQAERLINNLGSPR